MTKSVKSTDLRRRVRQVLDQVLKEGEPVVVQTYDTPQAVLIPYDEYEEYKTWREQRQERAAWLAELQSIADDVSARADLTDAEVNVLIEEAKETSPSS